MNKLIVIFLMALACFTASCTVGPDYQPPDPQLEKSFKVAGFTTPPPAGSWWNLFRDPQLDQYIRQAATAPSMKAALARYDAARAALGLSRADSFPTVTADAYSRRQRDSGRSNFSSGTYNDYRAGLNLSWEIDLWGRVRRQVRASAADSHAAQLDYQAALLSLHGEIARAYLSLRFTDAEISLLARTESLRRKARRLMKARFEQGVDSQIDYHRSVTEHERLLAELAQLQATRASFENALSALLGQRATTFRIAPNGKAPFIPGSPAAVPSDLLRRRPDLAARERRLAAASERIGFAVASYLPRLSLTGQGGLRALSSSDLLDSGSRLWRLGPELTQPIFQGPRGRSDRARAQANYREALALYRDTLVRAVQECESSLSDQRLLTAAVDAQSRGSSSSTQVAHLARKRYSAGLSDYFEVSDAERTALQEQRSVLSLERARALAVTRLLQALGGGWISTETR